MPHAITISLVCGWSSWNEVRSIQSNLVTYERSSPTRRWLLASICRSTSAVRAREYWSWPFVVLPPFLDIVFGARWWCRWVVYFSWGLKMNSTLLLQTVQKCWPLVDVRFAISLLTVLMSSVAMYIFRTDAKLFWRLQLLLYAINCSQYFTQGTKFVGYIDNVAMSSVLLCRAG